MTYVIYWTVYYGSKMPKNYIGSTTLAKHQSGYMGSVNSVEYKDLWREEIKFNRHLFKSHIIEVVDGDRDRALDRELWWQTKYNVAKNPLFINRSYAKKQFVGSSQSIQKAMVTKELNGVKHWTPESIQKQLDTKRRNGTLHLTPSSETKAKAQATKIKNGTHSSNPDMIAKQLETRRKNGTLNNSTPESIAKGLETKRKNGTLKRTPESIAKQLETKRANGTLNVRNEENIRKGQETMIARYGKMPFNSPESIAKRAATRRANNEARRLAKLR